MLQLRPNCEHCNKPLAPDSNEAMICSYECTFCQTCVASVLKNVCPNCGGNFTPRPIRPQHNLKGDHYLGQHPASDKVVFKPVDPAQHHAFARAIKDIAPGDR